MAETADPESSGENSGDRRRDGMPVGRPFRAGDSGNPRGRPKGLARKVRETLGDDDGAALSGFWAAVMSGELRTTVTKQGADGQTTQETVYETVSVADRIAVSKILAERGWGKPAQFVAIDEPDALGFDDGQADEIAATLDARLDELAEKRRQREARGQA